MHVSEAAARPQPPRSVWPLIVSICTLVFMAATSPFIARSTLAVLSVEATTPIDWVPSEFAPRRAYQEFVKEFESGDVVVVSWPGCELGSPALARLVEAAEWAKAWLEPTDHSNPQADAVYRKLKAAIEAAKVGDSDG